MSSRIINVALLLTGIVLQTPSIAAQALVESVNTAVSKNTATVDAEATAQATWRDTMAKQPASGQEKGCFHASYPNYLWEAVACSTAVKPGSHSTPNLVSANGPGPQEGGGIGDYVAVSQQGLISYADGTFKVSGVTSEMNSSVYEGVTNFSGPDNYGLQINTNWSLATENPDSSEYINTTILPTYTPAACENHPGCMIWQQFVYTSAFDGNPAVNSGWVGENSGYVFMQYWVFNWNSDGKTPCSTKASPFKGRLWQADGSSCFINSELQSVPIVPASDLGNVKLSASAEDNGNDSVYFFYQTDGWRVVEPDKVLDIASIWREVEFNVVGNTTRSQAVFNVGSVIAVTLNIRDGSTAPPLCDNNNGSNSQIGIVGQTGETNNLNLGPCTATVINGYPSIQFLEGTPAALSEALERAIIKPPGVVTAESGVIIPIHVTPL